MPAVTLLWATDETPVAVDLLAKPSVAKRPEVKALAVLRRHFEDIGNRKGIAALDRLATLLRAEVAHDAHLRRLRG